MVSSGSSHQSDSMLTLARRVCLNYCLIKAICLHSLFLPGTMLCKEPASIQMAQECCSECSVKMYRTSTEGVHVHGFQFHNFAIKVYFLIKSERSFIFLH